MTTWWALTSQDTLPTHDTLTVVATTSSPGHLWMFWAYDKPSRHPVHKTIRGKRILCGYKYIWDTPYLTEHSDYGPTLSHTFVATNLLANSTIWFYLCEPGGPYGLQIQGPLTSVTLPTLAPWVARVYVATNNQGVYYTDNFSANKDTPAGVPTWTPDSAGIEPGAAFLGFRGDPFNPSGRQYFLDVKGVYRHTTGDWYATLTRQTLIAYTGCEDDPASRFPNNGLEVNTNTPGWVACTFVGHHHVAGVPIHRLYFCLSLNYGSNWTITVAEDGTLDLPYPACLTVGKIQGTSPYPPGRVIFFMARKAWTAYCIRSIDGGATWDAFLIGRALQRFDFFAYEGHMIVDTNTQDTCYFTGSLTLADEYIISRSQSHGETWHRYDTLAPVPLGARISYLALNITLTDLVRVGTNVGRLDLYRTATAGATWQSATPPVHSPHLCISTVPGAPTSLYIVGQFLDAEMNNQLIWASIDEGATLYTKSGAHADVPDTGGGDSIPYTAGGIRAILPILT